MFFLFWFFHLFFHLFFLNVSFFFVIFWLFHWLFFKKIIDFLKKCFFSLIFPIFIICVLGKFVFFIFLFFCDLFSVFLFCFFFLKMFFHFLKSFHLMLFFTFHFCFLLHFSFVGAVFFFLPDGVFTLLLNLHDFVTEPFNPEHFFRYAYTVPYCLTRWPVFVCSGHVVNGKCSICSYQRRRNQWNVSHSWSTMRSWWMLSHSWSWGIFTLMECHEVFGGRNDQHPLICGQWDRWLMKVSVPRTHK